MALDGAFVVEVEKVEHEAAVVGAGRLKQPQAVVFLATRRATAETSRREFWITTFGFGTQGRCLNGQSRDHSGALFLFRLCNDHLGHDSTRSHRWLLYQPVNTSPPVFRQVPLKSISRIQTPPHTMRFVTRSWSNAMSE
jgi:hypothetical protein